MFSTLFAFWFYVLISLGLLWSLHPAAQAAQTSLGLPTAGSSLHFVGGSCVDAAVPLCFWRHPCFWAHVLAEAQFEGKGLFASVLPSLTSSFHLMRVHPVALRPSRTITAFSTLPSSPGSMDLSSDHLKSWNHRVTKAGKGL